MLAYRGPVKRNVTPRHPMQRQRGAKVETRGAHSSIASRIIRDCLIFARRNYGLNSARLQALGSSHVS